jgi:hypothetical protein
MSYDRSSTRGRLLVWLGTAGLVLLGLVAILSFVLVDGFMSRYRDTLTGTQSSLADVERTLEISETSLEALRSTVASVSAAADGAAESARTVGLAVDGAAEVIGEELPSSVESIREAMPGLIQAAEVIDSTLTTLAFLGVDYDPEVPLDQAFRRLDLELATIPETLRDNAALISGLTTQAQVFGDEALSISAQAAVLEGTLGSAQGLIEDYRVNVEMVTAVVDDSLAGLWTDRLIAMGVILVVVVVCGLAMVGMILTGRDLATASVAGVAVVKSLPRGRYL